MSASSGVNKSIVAPTCIPIPNVTSYLSLFRKADEGDVPSPLDGCRQFALVPHAIAGDTPRDNPAPLRQKVSQQPDIFEINRPFFDAKTTRPAALKKPSASTASVTISALFTLHNRLPLC
jgi:hypothetical protein